MSEPRPQTMPIQVSSTPATRRLGPSPWLWMILGCAIVAASGAVRVNQERLFADAERAAQTSPFPMRGLPAELGDWKMVGGELELEAQTLQIAGCTDYMYRSYADELTGVTLRVLVAFGPAIKVYPHSPLVCFPANGFKHRGGPWQRTIPIEDGESSRAASFQALVYGKPSAGLESLQEVFYSYRHDGRWAPTAEATERLFRHRPAMIKVQVERPIVSGEVGSEDSPIAEFLGELVPEIERHLAGKLGRAES